MILRGNRKYAIYDTPNELVEERERKKYGATRGEVLQELRNLGEIVFSMAGSGDIEDVWGVVKEDRGMVEVLYEMFVDGMDNDERGELFLKPLDSFPKRWVMVKRRLFEEGRLPSQIDEPVVWYKSVYGREDNSVRRLRKNDKRD